MSPDIITFEKSFQQRLSEYMDILGARGHLPSSGIQNEWYYYIESLLEPAGWQAIWKISRRKCEEFEIQFPTLVVVMVRDVIFQELEAVVDIVAVQDDISLPEQHEVPLTSLYPTKQQENEVLDINCTANCLDQLRFFYNHLWRPWDCDDENQDWLFIHLEARLQLYYDMQSGVVLHETGQHIRLLLQEAREIEQKIQAAQEQADSDEIDETGALAMMELQIRREEIKRKIEILENPLMRNLVVKRKYEVVQARRQHREHSHEVCFVWLGGTVDAFINTLTQVRNFVQPETYIKSCPLLQEALDKAIAGDTIILCPGIHHASSTGGLEEGGNIMGFLEPSATTIAAHEPGNVLLDWSANVTLENIAIDAHFVQMALSVRNGTVRMRNCCVVGGGNTSSTGILVLKGGHLEAQTCEFLNFGNGIVLDHDAKVTLTDCKITSCSTGIKMCEDSTIMLEKCHVSDCSEYGVKIEIIQQFGEGADSRRVGSVVMLESFQNITLDKTTVDGNKKGDVLMVQQLDNILYESGDSGCISHETEPDISA
ncbi:protein nessun dorma isoform X2 [Zootermopsis nevadensis]|uniref:SHC SH2 domain-binding protein 1 n=2 Tax=Zootermopsis nevadensis TaxID=136037 RepID=A0A067QNE5_ZOONE|nr:protein nessun dorma isoform X2 [Zootermopsis nevadensis]XP_021935389.1 protein nessun dorma isoform X2 [Zootermopsis nevadensis]KDR10984.1 SHC SH2 domain-binding protein 1 [Zootermopsis nevadensis]